MSLAIHAKRIAQEARVRSDRGGPADRGVDRRGLSGATNRPPPDADDYRPADDVGRG